MRLEAWGASDAGRKREYNEDALLVNTEAGLFAVADGMGGHLAGDRASRMAIAVLEEMMMEGGALAASRAEGASERVQDDPVLVAHELAGAFECASRAIHDFGERDARLRGMGTTLTALLIHRGQSHLAHVGDSRCYLLRDGSVRQLTTDHSWVEEQVRAGILTEDEAEQSGLKHVITRSIGFERDVDVDLLTLPANFGDRYLLCSDGLSNYLDEDVLARELAGCNGSDIASRLVEMANEMGGEDNITVVVIDVAGSA